MPRIDSQPAIHPSLFWTTFTCIQSRLACNNMSFCMASSACSHAFVLSGAHLSSRASSSATEQPVPLDAWSSARLGSALPKRSVRGCPQLMTVGLLNQPALHRLCIAMMFSHITTAFGACIKKAALKQPYGAVNAIHKIPHKLADHPARQPASLLGKAEIGRWLESLNLNNANWTGMCLLHSPCCSTCCACL